MKKQNKPSKKTEWENDFDKMWWNPQSTLMNWDGLFKEQLFSEKLFGLGEWRGDIENTLKKEIGNLVKMFISNLLHQRDNEIREWVKENGYWVETDGDCRVVSYDDLLTYLSNRV